MNDAYAAGILDGEGCLTVGTNKKVMTFDARVHCGMTKKAIFVLESLQKEYGGRLRMHRAATERWEEAWMWTLCGKEAVAALERISPQMQLKAQQAKLLIQLERMKSESVSEGGRAAWTEEMRKKAIAIRTTVMDLNRRGPEQPPVYREDYPEALYVRDVDGFLLQPKIPDLFDVAAWQAWSGTWPGSAISVPGGFLTRSISESPSSDDGYLESSLSDILEQDVAPKYSLSPTACAGILRRAKNRGRALPEQLRKALEARASMCETPLPGTSSEASSPAETDAGTESEPTKPEPANLFTAVETREGRVASLRRCRRATKGTTSIPKT